MPEIIETFEHAGMRVQIFEDPDYTGSDELGTTRVAVTAIRVSDSRLPELGDEHDLPDFTLTCDTCSGSGEALKLTYVTPGTSLHDHRSTRYGSVHEWAQAMLASDDIILGADHVHYTDCPVCSGHGHVPVEPAIYYRATHGSLAVVPVRVHPDWRPSLSPLPYDHWTDADGFAYDTPQTVSVALGTDVTTDRVREAIIEDVRSYASVIHGDVYMYKILGPDGAVHACCGAYIGDLDAARTDARRAAEEAADHLQAQRRLWLRFSGIAGLTPPFGV